MEVNRLVHQTLDKIQKVYKADVAGLRPASHPLPTRMAKSQKKWDDHLAKPKLKRRLKSIFAILWSKKENAPADRRP
jgi:hypothetical protein